MQSILNKIRVITFQFFKKMAYCYYFIIFRADAFAACFRGFEKSISSLSLTGFSFFLTGAAFFTAFFAGETDFFAWETDFFFGDTGFFGDTDFFGDADFLFAGLAVFFTIFRRR